MSGDKSCADTYCGPLYSEFFHSINPGHSSISLPNLNPSFIAVRHIILLGSSGSGGHVNQKHLKFLKSWTKHRGGDKDVMLINVCLLQTFYCLKYTLQLYIKNYNVGINVITAERRPPRRVCS